MIEAITQRIDAKMIMPIMLTIVLLTLMTSYLYLFKEPGIRYIDMRQTISQLELQPKDIGSLDADIKRLQSEIKDMSKELHGEGPRLPPNQMVAYIIAKLDELAVDHNIQLGGVRPGHPSTIMIFSERPYEIELQGHFFDLYQWLAEVEMKLGPLVIKQFKLQPLAENDGPRRMSLTLASYELQE